MTSSAQPRPIVVFDGECGLCNGFVAWLIQHDRDGRYLIAGSAGEVGRAVIDRSGLAREIAASTLIMWAGGEPKLRSAAVLTILAGLPWPWRLAGAGLVVPRPWRDAIYHWRAARRDRIAVEDAACGAPPAELVTLWRSRLATLDDVNALHAPG